MTRRMFLCAMYLTSALAAASVAPAQAQTPIINTWAGGGPASNAPAASVSVPAPNSVAVDTAGNYYVASEYTARIYKLSGAGTISVFAGGGTQYGTAADGGPATNAQLDSPAHLAMLNDVLYVVAAPGVRRIDTLTGTISTVVGGGASPFTNGMLATYWNEACPGGLAVAPSGDLYISDLCDQTIKRVDTTGVIRIVAGRPNVSGFAGDGGMAVLATFDYPRELALSPSGDLAVIDQGRRSEERRVRRIAAGAGGVVTGGDPTEIIRSLTAGGCCEVGTIWDGQPALTSDLRGLTAVAYDAAGDLYVGQAYEGPALLWRIDTGGVLHLVAGIDWSTPSPGPPGYGDGGSAVSAEFGRIRGVLATPGALVLADDVIHSVRAIDAASGIVTRLAGNGQLSYSGDGGPVSASQLFEPTAIQFDAAGNAYILDQRERALRVVSAATGIITSIAPPAPFIFRPSALAIHPVNGRIYFSNSDDRIWSFDRALNAIKAVAGTGRRTCSWDCEGGDPVDDLGDGDPALDATFRGPTSLVFDANANLYVADYGNHRVRRIDAAGIIRTVAGIDFAGNGGFDGDGIARSSRLSYPRTIALGPDGSVYIADSGNYLVRRVGAGFDGVVNGGADEFIETLVSGYQAWSLAVGGGGRVFYAGDGMHDVRVWDGGVETTYVSSTQIPGFAGDGGPAIDAQIAGPKGLALSGAGDLYIADTLNNRIRIVTSGPPNQPPVADAGPDQTVAANAACEAPVIFNGAASTDPDADPLTYTWSGSFGTASGATPTVTLGVGIHVITLTVSDGRGGSATDTVTVEVKDVTKPVLSVPASFTVPQTTLPTWAIATDNCSVTHDAPVVFPLGTTVVTVTATDPAGNFVTATTTVTVTPVPVTSATGLGTVTFSTSAGVFGNLVAIAEATLPAAGKPAGVTFPFGFFGWTVTNLLPGQSITVTMVFPANVAAGAAYWKVINGLWVDVTTLVGSKDGDNVLTITIADGGLGDADGLANGAISDPGGVGLASPNGPLPGRMNGSGHIDANSRRHHFEFRARERSTGEDSGSLVYEVNERRHGDENERRHDRARSGRFVSTGVTSVVFSDDSAFRPGRRPLPTVDTVDFAGTGRWNGVAGYTFRARAADVGEPGRGRDTFTLTISDRSGATVATVSGVLTGGNIQSTRVKR